MVGVWPVNLSASIPRKCLLLGLCAWLLVIQTQHVHASTMNAKEQTVTRRLTPAQYQNIISEVFGSDIDLGGRFEPELRVDGLFAIGASHASVAATGLEQYDAMGRAVAAQVFDLAHRGFMLPCKPKMVDKADDECARQFLIGVGELLYRRPLTNEQLETYVRAAGVGAESSKDFFEGMSLSLASMLSSPAFLFREQHIEPSPENSEIYRLDSYSIASQLSFFLWNSGPDRQLLAAARSGSLQTKSGLAEQVDRMIRSQRLEYGVREFFTDNFHLDAFDSLAKDPLLFPKYDAKISEQAREQALKTIIDVVLTRSADYREIFTTKKTFMTPSLGSIYHVPVFKNGPNGSPDNWQPYEFSDSVPYAGILTQVAFTALHSPAGRSSPTTRGKALREIMMCQLVPSPPGNVDFSEFEGADDLRDATARKRLGIHSSEPMCSGCHKITDPIGLALENFNGIGEFRTTDNGTKIDASGELNGMKFNGPSGFTQAIYNDPATTSCLVERLAAYATGRNLEQPYYKKWVSDLESVFKQSGFRLPELIREIALSDALYDLPSIALTTAFLPSSGISKSHN